MPAAGQFQYQVKTEPVSTLPEAVAESKWHQPWSVPVRQRNIATALQAPATVLVQSVFAEATLVSKWFQPLSEPVRTRAALLAALQRAYFAEPFGLTQPEAVSEDKWHQPWSSPVRIKPGLIAALQRTQTQDTSLVPIRGIPTWFFEPFSEPQRHRPRLQPGLQPTTAIGTPSQITAIMAAIESRDAMAATLYVAASLSGATVSIVEIVPKYANISTAYPASTYANVSIIEISS